MLLLFALLLRIPATGPATVHVTFSPLTKAAYLVAKKSQVITKPKVTFPLKKQNRQLVIPTSKGPKVFTDIVIDDAAIKKDIGETESTIYDYLGYLPDFRCHLINVHYYETSAYLLIDAAGKQITLWGEPLFAPDMQHIVATCQGIEYSGGQPNSLQLLEMRNGALREVWSLKPQTWEPYRIGWASSNTLLLSKEMWTEKSQGTTYTYAKLTITP